MVIVPSVYAVHVGPLSSERKGRRGNLGRRIKRSIRRPLRAAPPEEADEAHGTTFVISVTAITAPVVLNAGANDEPEVAAVPDKCLPDCDRQIRFGCCLAVTQGGVHQSVDEFATALNSGMELLPCQYVGVMADAQPGSQDIHEQPVGP